jgi:hypothetical protein
MFFNQLNINNAPLYLFSVIRDILTIISGSNFRGGTLPAVHGTSAAGNDTANGRMVASDDHADALILILITPRCNVSLTNNVLDDTLQRVYDHNPFVSTESGKSIFWGTLNVEHRIGRMEGVEKWMAGLGAGSPFESRCEKGNCNLIRIC